MSQGIGRVHFLHIQLLRQVAIAAACMALLALGVTPGSATVNDVYWGGAEVFRGYVNQGGVPAPVNSAFGRATDVAVDSTNGKIYWIEGDPNTGTYHIWAGNLNGTGTRQSLLQVPWWSSQLEIDPVGQKLYWSDTALNRQIYWTSIASPAVNPLLPNAPVASLRAFALDLRTTKQDLYYIDGNDVWRYNLPTGTQTKLPNSITAFSGVNSGLSLDLCNDRLIILVDENNVQPAAIIQADMATAGNVVPLLPPSGGGAGNGSRKKIVVDANARTMYWVLPFNGSVSEVRSADLNGTNMRVMASHPTIPLAGFSGLALDLALTDCTTVGVNKDFMNNTGQSVDGVQILIQGIYANVQHYDGAGAYQFASFTAAPDGNGNTLLTWSNPGSAVPPGQIIHVGFNVPGSLVNIQSVSWTSNGVVTGCPHQVSTNTHDWGSPGSQVVYSNIVLLCRPIPRYVGGLVVEWHVRPVPLADLNPRVRRRPIRTDRIKRAPIRLEPGATAAVEVPTAPRNAVSGVIVYKVGINPGLTGDVTTDFVQFPVGRRR